MAKLILTLGGNRIREFALDREKMIIGRRSSSDIQVENLAVSGEHAKIITILNDSFLEDLKSTNGTFVNGVLIKKQSLQNGDVITVGKHKLHYVNEHSSKEGFDQTIFLRDDKSPTRKAAPTIAEAKNQSTQDLGNTDLDRTMDTEPPTTGPHLSVISGEKSGEILHLTKTVTTLGRAGAQVAAIIFKDDSYYLIHIETSTDEKLPLLNGSEISDEHETLSSNDEIVVNGVKMIFQLD